MIGKFFIGQLIRASEAFSVFPCILCIPWLWLRRSTTDYTEHTEFTDRNLIYTGTTQGHLFDLAQ